VNMAEPTDVPALLSPDETRRLTELSRAIKAAARAVVLYPSGHPAIVATLRRMAEATSARHLSEPLTITVLPDSLKIQDRGPAKPDPTIVELAELLHQHLIGEITIHPGGDVEAWRQFLLLVGRAPDEVRAEGGIARAWTTMAGRHVDLREIDYSEVLRERSGGRPAVWDRVVENCLQGDAFDLDDEAIRELLELTADPERLGELFTDLEQRAAAVGEGAIGQRAAALLRMLRGIVEAVSQVDPERLEPVLKNMSTAVGQLAPDTLLDLLQQPGAQSDGDGEDRALVNAVVSRMSDQTIARFVARNVISGTTSTDRVAAAFQTLVKDREDRQRLLTLAHKDVAESPLGNTDGFEGVWSKVAETMLTEYSDESYVSDEYGRELSSARTRAIEVEQVSDDPPERISAWLGTVATTALRSLDLAVVIDVLAVEDQDQRWGEMMTPVVALIEDLLLVGDFEAADRLVRVIVDHAAGGESKVRQQYAVTAIDLLVAGPMMRHIGTHLSTIDDSEFEQVKRMCVSLGEVMVKPLAEALSTEERARPRQRLTDVLLAFGVVGRRTAERLKSSANPAVRRTAIYLLREFGGSEALPDLTELLDDNEPQIQREAVRAILNIGTEQAYQVLEKALATGTEQSREAIMQSMSAMRDERAAPLFVYIIRHVSHRGRLAAVYLRAIEALGSLRDPEGVKPLKEALYRGEWWAPRRNALLRSAAAAALARIGTGEARAVLEEAVASGPRSLRAVVRPHLSHLSSRPTAAPGARS